LISALVLTHLGELAPSEVLAPVVSPACSPSRRGRGRAAVEVQQPTADRFPAPGIACAFKNAGPARPLQDPDERAPVHGARKDGPSRLGQQRCRRPGTRPRPAPVSTPGRPDAVAADGGSQRGSLGRPGGMKNPDREGGCPRRQPPPTRLPPSRVPSFSWELRFECPSIASMPEGSKSKPSMAGGQPQGPLERVVFSRLAHGGKPSALRRRGVQLRTAVQRPGRRRPALRLLLRHREVQARSSTAPAPSHRSRHSVQSPASRSFRCSRDLESAWASDPTSCSWRNEPLTPDHPPSLNPP